MQTPPERPSASSAFGYPGQVHAHRHGPHGYLDDAHYKPWLRDEFTYRCVYWICREIWLPDGQASFSVEHLVPTSTAPTGPTDYDTLASACCLCNAFRSAEPLPVDPRAGLGRHLNVEADGPVHGLTPAGEVLIRICKLNRADLTRFRRMMLDVLASLRTKQETGAQELYRRYLGYPADLPDLTIYRPPGGNTRPEGIDQSAFARRARGELPPTY